MNNTLLLIICDFLLLSLLALAKFETPEEDRPEVDVLPEDPIQAQEDIIEVLKLSLEMEEESNENMAASLLETRKSLESTSSNLEEREKELQMTQAEREALAKQKEDLESDLQQRMAILETTRKDAERKLRQMEALQKELQAKQDAVAQEEARRKELELANREVEQKAQQLGTQLQLAEAESRLVRENLEQVRSEVSLVRDENQRLQEHASQLATQLTDGVNAQTERLTEIAEEVRKAQPRNANQIFSDFVGSGVTLELRYQKYFRGGDERTVTIRPVIVTDGQDTKAVFSWDDTGLTENDLRNTNLNLRGNIRLGRYAYPLKSFDLLSIDNRVLAMQLEPEWIKFLESEPFYIATNPLQFEHAVLIDPENGSSGEARFKIEMNTPEHFRIDSRLMNRLMGEFSPRKANMMFNKNGDFMGVLVNKDYAAHIDNFVPSETINLNQSDTLRQLQIGYTRMINQVRRLPSGLR